MDTRKILLRRRSLVGAGATGAVLIAGTALYRAAPNFWRQFVREWNRPVEPPPRRPNPYQWDGRGLHAAWLGHATVLLKMGGFTVLTDPVFSQRAGIHLGLFTLGIKRLVAPALAPPDLPHIDLVLLSHAHMDHFDIPTLRALAHPQTRVVTAWETADLLEGMRYGAVRELRWGETIEEEGIRVRAFPVNHWGARMRTDTYRGYNGYLIEAGGYRVLFAGDTADTGAFGELADRRGIDLAIMPIGAYDPWIRYHCTPEQAWRMGNEARAARFLPIHHQTFALSREPRFEPIERFLAAAGSAQDRVVAREVGDEFRHA